MPEEGRTNEAIQNIILLILFSYVFRYSELIVKVVSMIYLTGLELLIKTNIVFYLIHHFSFLILDIIEKLYLLFYWYLLYVNIIIIWNFEDLQSVGQVFSNGVNYMFN